MSDAVQEAIQQTINAHDVVIFMKGTPEQPMCGFSGVVVQIFDHLGVEFVGVNVLADPEVRQGIKDYSNWPTIPQVYVKGEFLGGSDIMREMFESGELRDMLAEKGVVAA